jgi:hypothetical protein
MELKRAIFLFLRSNTHLAVLIVYICSLLASVFLTQGGAVPAVLTVGYLTAATVLFFTRRGAQEIVHEQEEDRNRAISEKIEKAQETRGRLSYLRIPDEDVKNAIEAFLLVSGEYLEACRSKGTYLPQGFHEIEKTFETCESYYQAIDDISSSSRYRFDDKKQTEAEAEGVKNTTLELIRSSTDRLRQLSKDGLRSYGGGEELNTHKDMDEL